MHPPGNGISSRRRPVLVHRPTGRADGRKFSVRTDVAAESDGIRQTKQTFQAERSLAPTVSPESATAISVATVSVTAEVTAVPGPRCIETPQSVPVVASRNRQAAWHPRSYRLPVASLANQAETSVSRLTTPTAQSVGLSVGEATATRSANRKDAIGTSPDSVWAWSRMPAPASAASGRYQARHKAPKPLQQSRATLPHDAAEAAILHKPRRMQQLWAANSTLPCGHCGHCGHCGPSRSPSFFSRSVIITFRSTTLPSASSRSIVGSVSTPSSSASLPSSPPSS